MSTKLTDLPKGWQWKEIDSFCETSSGGTPSRARQDYFKGDIPWVKIGDMRNWVISETEERISKIGLENSSAKVFPKGTVLMSIFATIGAVSILDIEATTNQAIAGITPDPKIASGKYLAYYLLSIRPEMEAKSRGVAQKNINQKILRSIQVAIPPLNIQNSIVDVLDKTRALQQKREQANQLANKLLQAVFMQMFGDPVTNPLGWRKVKLIDVCNRITDGTHITPSYKDDGVIFLSAKNIQEDNLALDFDNVKHISGEEHKKLTQRVKPEKHDILYRKVGVGFGVARAIKTDVELSIFVSLALMKPNHSLIDWKFLETMLNSDYVRDQAKLRIKGIGVPDLHLEEIRDFDILLPPMEMQRKFAGVVEETETLIIHQRKTRTKIEELFQSLMSKVFKGELSTSVVD